MTDALGFNLQILSDDELLERCEQLNKRIVYAGRFGSADLIYQLRLMLDAVSVERRERSFAAQMAKMIAAPDVAVETDPDLANEQREKTEAQSAKSTPKPAIRPRPMLGFRDRTKPTSTKE